MCKFHKALLCLGTLFFCSSYLKGQDYSSFARLTNRINILSKTHPNLIKVNSLTKTLGGKDIWMLSIGSGKIDDKPGIAVVGGVEGTHLLGVELSIGFAENLLKDQSRERLDSILSRNTFYIFPNMSPDATEQYVDKLRFARSGNARQTDDDRDGQLNEDPFEDLNNDGKISWIRVEDATGNYIINPEEPRSMVLADASKGEKGKYLLLSEGIDNDKDGAYNEDGPGGVHFNKNMSYAYPNFVPGSGEHMVSEIENRTLLDRLFEMFNIHSVVTFGPYNNLSNPVAFNAPAVAKRIISGYYEADAKTNAFVSELYIKTLGVKDAPKTAVPGGDFANWAYFHYGRNSFSTPGWWVPKAKADTSKKEKEFKREDPTANFLRWAGGQERIKDYFTDWKRIDHPDFPGQVVEIGGIDPFVLNNPPYHMVAEIAKKHTDFLIALSKLSPEIEIVNVKTEKLNGGLTRINATVLNTSPLATQTKVGEKSYWIKKITVKLQLNGNQTVVSGKKSQSIDAIEGNGNQTFTWLVKGAGKLSIEAGSPTTGIKTKDITL